MVKNIPVLPLQSPSTTTNQCQRLVLNFIENISETPINVTGTDIITFLRREQRDKLNADSRWALFDRKSADRVTVGSVLKVTYFPSKSELNRPATFTGFLIALRRHPSEPTFSLRTIVDNIGVEQLFPVFSPMISKIEVVKRAIKTKSYKAYWLRDKPEKAAEFINKKSKKQRK